MSGRLQKLMGLILATGGLMVTGCSRPMTANIELRKKNQNLTHRVEQLENQVKALATSRPASNGGTVDLSRLYVASGLSFGKLTGVDGSTLKVYVTPKDQSGDALKAAGGFQIEAFDLTKGASALAGQWTFTPEQADKAWVGKGLLYEYVLECPLKTTPESDLRVRVVFLDSLTGQKIEAETPAKLVR